MTKRKPLSAAPGLDGNYSGALQSLIRTYTGDEYPCQDFVGIDSAGRPCVILHFAHFDDDGENRDYETFYFSNLSTAEKAFLLLNEIDKVAFGEFVEEKNKPLNRGV